MVQDKYRTCQTMCFCGVFPEIRRAWASVDNSFFLWRYDRRWAVLQTGMVPWLRVLGGCALPVRLQSAAISVLGMEQTLLAVLSMLGHSGLLMFLD